MIWSYEAFHEIKQITMQTEINPQIQLSVQSQKISGFKLASNTTIQPKYAQCLICVPAGRSSTAGLNNLELKKAKISLKVKVGDYQKYLLKDIVIKSIKDINLKVRKDLSVKNMFKQESSQIVKHDYTKSSTLKPNQPIGNNVISDTKPIDNHVPSNQIPQQNQNQTNFNCSKCKQTLKTHAYYLGNDNYAQCNACGRINTPGQAYVYCQKCSPWGFCSECTSKGIVPFGCDTKSCAKCGKHSLKSYKFYGGNFNYKNCNNCKRDIGMNNFYWYCTNCNSYGYCFPCTLDGKCGIKG